MMSFLERNHSHYLFLKKFIGKTRVVVDSERIKNVDIKGNGGPPECD